MCIYINIMMEYYISSNIAAARPCAALLSRGPLRISGREDINVLCLNMRKC